ncbi:hypothetical protein [Pararhizobium mangrovi]|uniref:hypothetical protein n=1 Tax=Pararhizobium mangrovi TaxID=2590452 RepID=UPI0015E8748B|nr:hypothetical protein [Pararhizobium mangrovi]
MEEAAFDYTPLHELFEDPFLRRAFQNADRDTGGAFVIPEPYEPDFDGGAAAELEMA